MKNYWLGVGIVSLLFAGGLIWHKQVFSNNKLIEMMETPTKLKGKTDDYCLYQTALDPKEPNELAIKVTFICGERRALNTISWVTILKPTLGGLIEQIAGINGINYFGKDLDCKVNGKLVDNDFELHPDDQIVCQVIYEKT